MADEIKNAINDLVQDAVAVVEEPCDASEILAEGESAAEDEIAKIHKAASDAGASARASLGKILGCGALPFASNGPVRGVVTKDPNAPK